MTSAARRWLHRAATAVTVVTASALVLLGASVGLQSTHVAPLPTTRTAGTSVPDGRALLLVSHKAKHPHRKIKKYVVRPGDTAAGIATRYHAWTAQLIAINHASLFHPGDVIRIPVVVKAARACKRHRHHFTGYLADNRDQHGEKHKPKKHKPKKHKPKPPRSSGDKPGKPGKKHHAHRHPDHGWVHAHASRAEVRRLIIKRAVHHGVNPDLALAIAWQEAGWQQKRVSYAGALGAMQVMPGTGRWMSDYLGRKLNLRNLHDNVTAGVVLIKILRSQAGLRYAVAGYYQGLAGVRRYGMYRSTKQYVANVLAIKKQIARGWNPA